MEKLLSLAILLFFILLPSVEAISLGTLVKNDFAAVKQDESAKFTILFWNVESSPYIVETKIESSPENWTVIINPERFLLDSTTGSESIFLPYQKNPVRAFPINVFVKPVSAKPGNYTLVLSAAAGYPGNTINFFQERKFKLTVEVEGKAEAEGSSQTSIQEPSMPTGETAQVQNYLNYVLYVVVLVCILFVSLLIYKYG
jgi:hypothetical protein